MKKIEDLDQVQEAQDNNLEPGPQVVQIKNVEDVKEKEYLRIEFDIAHGPHKGKIQEIMDNTNRDKWPNMGAFYASYKKQALPFFKRFIVAVEKSNDDFKFDFDETKLIGKYFVANFGEEEYEQNGEIKESIKAVEARSISSLKEGNIDVPKKKTVKRSESTSSSNNDPEKIGNLDDLPF